MKNVIFPEIRHQTLQSKTILMIMRNNLLKFFKYCIIEIKSILPRENRCLYLKVSKLTKIIDRILLNIIVW